MSTADEYGFGWLVGWLVRCLNCVCGWPKLVILG